MTKNKTPHLCGGTFFDLLLETRKTRSKARDKFNGGTDGLSATAVFDGLVEIVTGENVSSRGGTSSKCVSNYKNCTSSKGVYIPFTNPVTQSAFDAKYTAKSAELYTRMSEFINKFLNRDKCEWLVRALIETMQKELVDTEIAINYTESMKVSELHTADSIVFLPFLLSVLHYVVEKCPDCESGRKTFEEWYTQSSKKGEWKFKSNIGSGLAHMNVIMDMSIPAQHGSESSPVSITATATEKTINKNVDDTRSDREVITENLSKGLQPLIKALEETNKNIHVENLTEPLVALSEAIKNHEHETAEKIRSNELFNAFRDDYDRIIKYCIDTDPSAEPISIYLHDEINELQNKWEFDIRKVSEVDKRSLMQEVISTLSEFTNYLSEKYMRLLNNGDRLIFRNQSPEEGERLRNEFSPKTFELRCKLKELYKRLWPTSEIEHSDVKRISKEQNCFFVKNDNLARIPEDKRLSRTEQINDIISEIKEKRIKVNLFGLGGIGKTTLLKDICLELFDSTDEQKWEIGYWKCKQANNNLFDLLVALSQSPKFNGYSFEDIKSYFFSTEKNTILFIDGVDPINDNELINEISGWHKTRIIVTSRYREIADNEFVNIQVKPFNSKDCFKLFEMYNSNVTENDRETVDNIIRLAGYHTYLITLLAKLSKQDSSLEEYYVKTKSNGFAWDDLQFSDHYSDNKNATVANCISYLFDFSNKSTQEVWILKMFSSLPDSFVITETELSEWFHIANPKNAVRSLINENIMFVEHKEYYIHPIVKEAIKLTYEDHRIPYTLLRDFLRETIIGAEQNIRRYNAAYNAISNYVSELIDEYSANRIIKELIRIAHYTHDNKEIPIALAYYSLSSNIITSQNGYESNIELLESYWESEYHQGYILSTSDNNFENSFEYLVRAVNVSEQIAIEYKVIDHNSVETVNQVNKAGTTKNSIHNIPGETIKLRKVNINSQTEQCLSRIAVSYDHLGYVCTSHDMIPHFFNEGPFDTPKSLVPSELLSKALGYRRWLSENNSCESYIHDIAWTEDNYGCCLSLADNHIDMLRAHHYLTDALASRNEYWENKKNSSTEIPWTENNLANWYLIVDSKQRALFRHYRKECSYNNVKSLYESAIKKYLKIDETDKSNHKLTIAGIINNYAVLLTKFCYYDEAKAQFERALSLYDSDSKSLGKDKIADNKEKTLALEQNPEQKMDFTIFSGARSIIISSEHKGFIF